MEMTLSHHYLDANLNILDNLGFPKALALDILALEGVVLKNSFDRMSLDPFVDCLEAAIDFTSNPNIALHLGHKFRVGTFGRTGNLYAYCENLREVISMNNRYQKIAIDAGNVNYMSDDIGGHYMCFEPYYSDIEKYRPITDIIMASYVTTYRWLTWGSGEGIGLTHLPYPEPDDIRPHEEIFKSDLIFDSKYTRLGFSETAMSQHITTHDPERLAQVQIKLDRLLGLHMAIEAFEQGVDAAIKGAVETGQVTSTIVAERMGMSWSALRTQLNASGETMRPRLDRIRKEMFAEKYKSGQSFSQIAMSLAYNDQAAMNRAFKRWFGMTPSQWQKQQAPEKT